MKVHFLRLFVVPMLLGGLCCSCAGVPSPAAPPAPPSEVPSALRIPKDVIINIDKVSSSSSSSAALSLPSSGTALTLKGIVGSGGEFSDEISITTDEVQLINRALTKFLDPLHQLRIPVGEKIRNFKGLAVIMQGEGLGSPGDVIEFKIDFADFDYDGDGSPEGCSGNTAKLPICMRIWANSPLTTLIGQREAAAVFTAFPSDINPGAGRLKVIALDHTIGFPFFNGAAVGIGYDHLNPEDKSTELFVNVEPQEVSTLTKATRMKKEVFDFGTKLHASISQQGPDTTAVKTMNSIIGLTNFGGLDLALNQGVFRWKEDEDFMSATSHSNIGGFDELDNQCVQIATASSVDRSVCLDLGIDVEGISIVGLPEPADASLPDDFPASPTF